MAVSADGAVWSWGNNQNGRLGQGDERHRARPERIASLADTRILQVAEMSSPCCSRRRVVLSRSGEMPTSTPVSRFCSLRKFN